MRRVVAFLVIVLMTMPAVARSGDEPPEHYDDLLREVQTIRRELHELQLRSIRSRANNADGQIGVAISYLRGAEIELQRKRDEMRDLLEAVRQRQR